MRTPRLPGQQGVDIRQTHATNGTSAQDLAVEHGVSVLTIYNLLNARTYAHVGGPVQEARHRLEPTAAATEIRRTALRVMYDGIDVRSDDCFLWQGSVTSDGY